MGRGEWGPPSELFEAILDVVESIPPGRVMTYGDVAEASGAGRRAARAVGTCMSRFGSDVPWWRVVQASGHFPACHDAEALAHYLAESTPLVGGLAGGGAPTGRRIDLTAARWAP